MQVLDKVSAVLKQKGTQIWAVKLDATIYDALQIIADKGIGALLVIEDGRLLGVFSEREYARGVALKGRSSRDTRVVDVMRSPAVTIGPNESVNDAMRRMTEHRIRHLPVCDEDGTVLGVLSIGDLVKWIITSHEQTIEQLHSYIAGHYDTTARRGFQQIYYSESAVAMHSHP